jgi:toxin ParE1/3/4
MPLGKWNIARAADDFMAHHVISPAAERDIQAILAWTHEQFGVRGRLRYEALLVRAIHDVVENPQRTGSQARPEIAPSAWTYHLWHSRDRVEPPGDRVHRPRHVLLYRIGKDGQVEIGRVLHDAMDLARHLPDEYRPRPPGEPAPAQRVSEQLDD